MEDKEERIVLASEREYEDENAPATTDAKALKKQKSAAKKAAKKAKEENKTTLEIVLEYVRVIAIAVIVAFVLCKFVIINAVVPSSSMYPTIQKGDRLIGWRLAYKFSDVERGDVVIFKCPEAGDDYDKLFIKRVIALPGETIAIRGGQVYITTTDGTTFQLEENYLNETPYENGSVSNMEVTLGDDEYWCMGDNRNNSHDCRYFGPVKESRIVAKAGFKYYKGFSIFKNE